MKARALSAVAAVALLAASCGMPQRKDTSVVGKVAATPSAAAAVVARYNAVRAQADERLDGSVLPRIEGGDLLDIDRGVYFVSVRVAKPAGFAAVRLAPPEQVVAPRFDSYPLWFAVLARDREGGNKRVAVFERADSVSPWRMTMAPETTPDAVLPDIVEDDTGAAVVVGPQDGTGTGLTPAEVLQRYAGALAPGESADDDLFAPDAFRTRTRRFQQSQQALPFATFEQAWTAQPPRFALRVEDGGALVFGTVDRRDSYSVLPSSYIDWDDDADTAAYLPGRVYGSAVLDYSHQLLFYVPPRGEGRPRLIGQYGGVIDGEGS